MKSNLSEPLKHVMLRTQHVLPASCTIERGMLWVEPPGIECEGFQVQGPGDRFATLAIKGDQAYMVFKHGIAHRKQAFSKTIDDDFIDATVMLFRRLFSDGTPPS